MCTAVCENHAPSRMAYWEEDEISSIAPTHRPRCPARSYAAWPSPTSTD